MSRTTLLRTSTVAFIISALLVTGGPAFAGKPSWAGGGKKGQQEEQGGQDDHGGKGHGHKGEQDQGEKKGENSYFDEHHRTVVREYLDQEFQSGHCPPGLAKKHNGCMPPGQAKKWGVGRPLPPEVVYYEIPQSVVVKLGPPPSGHRYVRVASDILMIAVGTGMVVDAIQDLNR